MVKWWILFIFLVPLVTFASDKDKLRADHLYEAIKRNGENITVLIYNRPDEEVVPEFVQRKVEVSWITTSSMEETDRLCLTYHRRAMRTQGKDPTKDQPNMYHGCALPDYPEEGQCTIIVQMPTVRFSKLMRTFGEEALHCFIGKFHD